MCTLKEMVRTFKESHVYFEGNYVYFEGNRQDKMPAKARVLR